MTDARTIVQRMLAKKVPNELSHGEVVYSVSEDELVALVAAVQRNARKSIIADRSFLHGELRRTMMRGAVKP